MRQQLVSCLNLVESSCAANEYRGPKELARAGSVPFVVLGGRSWDAGGDADAMQVHTRAGSKDKTTKRGGNESKSEQF